MGQKNSILIVGIIIMSLQLNSLFAKVIPENIDTMGWNFLIDKINKEIKISYSYYHSSLDGINNKILRINAELDAQTFKTPRNFLNLYSNKRSLEKEKERRENQLEIKILEIRYRKGIELIKLLYEKVLGLDHHFSGLQTFKNISLLSNPNNYPEFQKTQALLQERIKKKYEVEIPNLLQTNPYISATFSLLGSLFGNHKAEDRQKDIEEIACILDFTVRMNSDLSVIQYETEYLKDANELLKKECEELFEDYVKVVGYLVPLHTCRQSDDWEKVVEKLDHFIKNIEEEENHQEIEFTTTARSLVNLEFATKRVAGFISKYHDFINQGIQYYLKFDKIISSYENEKICQEKMPKQFNEIKLDIKNTIEKFTNTYQLSEIQGSRLKKLLYGDIP